MVGPLVSVITATRDRHADLEECICQVRAQTYRPLEHVIVSDGPDPVLRDFLFYEYGVGMGSPADRGLLTEEDIPIIFQETGRVWSDEMTESDGAAAFQVAQLLGRGPLQMWFSDDEEMDPDHIQDLVELLESQRVDFVYSKARWYTAPHIHPRQDRIIGSIPPTAASITNCLYRTALLDYGKFETHRGRGTDWNQVSAWIAAGASYAMLDRVSFTHRADQIGGVNSNTTKQPLRGHHR